MNRGFSLPSETNGSVGLSAQGDGWQFVGEERALLEAIAASLPQAACGSEVAPQEGQGLVILGGSGLEDGYPLEGDRLRRWLDRAASARFVRVILLSSTLVYPPKFSHPGMVPPCRPARRGHYPRSEAWLLLEDEARAQCTRLGVSLEVVRVVPVILPGRGDLFSRMLTKRWQPVFFGHNPPLQLLRFEGFLAQLRTILNEEPLALQHLTPPDAAPLRRILRQAGTLPVPLPTWLHRVGRVLLRPFGCADMDMAERLRFAWTAGSRSFCLAEKAAGPDETVLQTVDGFCGGKAQARSACDPFGFSPRYVDRHPVVRYLHDIHWRVEYEGLEHVPVSGPAVMVGVHRGFMPYDGTQFLLAVARKHRRYLRFLVHPSLLKMPGLTPFISGLGGIPAAGHNADWVLRQGQLLGVFPEGIEGAFSYYREAYRLRPFGRDEYIKIALRNRVPLVPFVTVGSAEIFPVLAKLNLPAWQRFSHWPCFPLAPPFPFLPMPLPSKWHTRVLAPIPVHETHPPEAASDRETVRAIGLKVEQCLLQNLQQMRESRKHIFWGSIFENPEHPQMVTSPGDVK